ncbi:MAG: hypothetical protein M3R64_00055 [Pseudomonadota bacterium]|nr:hypothetical protein [Pseudomonadota bacterium]
MTDRTTPLQLHSMRKLEAVVHAEDRGLVEHVLRDAGVAGWTMIRDVAGLGHTGFHQARTIFSDETGLVMFVGVGTHAVISVATSGLADIFEHRPGVVFLSQVEVMRSGYFGSDQS